MTPWQFWTFVFDTSHFGTLFLTRRILELHRWHSRFLQMFCHTVWFRDIAFDTHVSWELAPDTRHPWHDVWRQYDFEDRKLPSLFINFHYLTRPRLEVCLWHVIKWKQPRISEIQVEFNWNYWKFSPQFLQAWQPVSIPSRFETSWQSKDICWEVTPGTTAASYGQKNWHCGGVSTRISNIWMV